MYISKEEMDIIIEEYKKEFNVTNPKLHSQKFLLFATKWKEEKEFKNIPLHFNPKHK
jgi:hypothetical protein